MTTAGALLVTLRPRQWVKNLFVVAPLIFSKHLLDADYALRTLAATLAFCALSGAVYVFNDLRDATQDRLHPRKQHRPIASGALSETTAVRALVALGLGALAVCFALGWRLGVTATAYAALNLAYSVGLKRVAFVDVLLIAGGFLLRVVAGAVAIAVPISPWLLACTALLAAMLGFGKRAHELAQAEAAGRDPRDTRAALHGYHPGALRGIMYALAAATGAAYALYTQDDRTVAFFHTRQLIWTLPFCLVGIERFLRLALWRPRPESPTEAMLRDWPFMLNILAWGIVVLAIIYGSRLP